MALRLEAQIGADGSGFFNTMNRVDARVRGFATALSGLRGTLGTVFGVYSVGAFTRSILEMADSITEMADRLGVGAEWLQRFQYAAKQSGTDIDAVAVAIENLNKAREEVFAGGPAGAKTMAAGGKLGIGAAQWQMRSEDIIELIAKAVRAGDPQELSPAVQELLGKPFKQLMALFATDMEATMSQAMIMSDETRKALAGANDAWDRLLHTVKVIAAGPLKWILDTLGKGLVGLTFATQLIGNFLGNLIGNQMEAFSMIKSGDIMGGFKKLSVPFGDIKDAFNDALERSASSAKKVEDSLKFGGGSEKTNAAARAFSYGQPNFAAANISRSMVRGDVATDELIRVGNFLGRNRDSVGSLWQEQIKIGNKQALLQAGILTQVSLTNTILRTVSLGTMGIPST